MADFKTNSTIKDAVVTVSQESIIIDTKAIAEQADRIAELEAELAEEKKRADQAVLSAQHQLRQNTRLREALGKYGVHDIECATRNHKATRIWKDTCICGLSQALEAGHD